MMSLPRTASSTASSSSTEPWTKVKPEWPFAMSQVGKASCGQSIENDHLVTAFEQRLNEVRPYKPGATGNEVTRHDQ